MMLISDVFATRLRLVFVLHQTSLEHCDKELSWFKLHCWRLLTKITGSRETDKRTAKNTNSIFETANFSGHVSLLFTLEFGPSATFSTGCECSPCSLMFSKREPFADIPISARSAVIKVSKIRRFYSRKTVPNTYNKGMGIGSRQIADLVEFKG